MSATSAELLLDLRAELAEGAIWNPQTSRLCFVDILGHKVYEYDPASGQRREFSAPDRVSTVVPRRKGGLAVALAGGLAGLDPATGEFRMLAVPAGHDTAKTRFNDGKCDPQGRFWAGTFGKPAVPGGEPPGALFRFGPDGPKRMVTGIGCSNGLAWSLDSRRMYYIDTFTRKVDGFDFDPASGDISNRRAVIVIPPEAGLPDGCTLDAEGMLWVAEWSGRRVSRWDPEKGKFLGQVSVPVPLVSSCAFGGKDLSTLYITTAREGMTPEQVAKDPTSGGIYVCRPGVRGIPANSYAG